MRNEGDCQGIQSRLWCARDAAQNGLFSMLSAFPNKIKRLRVERDAPFGRHLFACFIGALVERDLRLSGGLEGRLDFGFQWLADVTYEARVRCAANLKIIAGLGQTEFSVYCAADYICVAVVLSIVLPPTDGTEAERVRKIESFETAAEAAHTRKCIHIWSDAVLVTESRKYLQGGPLLALLAVTGYCAAG